MPEFVDFDSVLKELNISETDLTKLISEGEIIAFKDDVTQKLKFLTSDVTKLKEEIKGKVYLTLEEVEKMTKIKQNDIMNMISEGKLQAFKDPTEKGIIKFRKSDVVKMIKKNSGTSTVETTQEKKEELKEKPIQQPVKTPKKQITATTQTKKQKKEKYN